MLHITPWERSALALLASGASLAEIARQLDVTEGEAETRLLALFSKLGAAGRNDAIAAASRRGLLYA